MNGRQTLQLKYLEATGLRWFLQAPSACTVASRYYSFQSPNNEFGRILFKFFFSPWDFSFTAVIHYVA